MSTELWTFTTAAYNVLPALKQATARLQKVSEQVDRFVRDASGLAAKAGLGKGELAAFLLHRHWRIDDKHCMMEHPRVLESGTIGLVTAASDVQARNRAGGVPSRWAAPSEQEPCARSNSPQVHMYWKSTRSSPASVVS
jgi:hypothetical protein